MMEDDGTPIDALIPVAVDQDLLQFSPVEKGRLSPVKKGCGAGVRY
jgi:hypothetical protein